jgi:hypothetical protein
MNLVVFHIANKTELDMILKEEQIIERLDKFKLKWPSFNYKIEREEITNTLVVKQVSMYEQAN